MSESHIRVLSRALSDQISAGEVLERASSAVKELVENSLDAGADEIFIDVEEAGRKRLSVTDNGIGMNMEDAQLSVLRHATSKISKTEDLRAITTMGFRGEALASMAAVTRMSMTTRDRDSDTGTYMHIEGAEMVECRECAAPRGTQIVLEDLFFNTPARLKFLKTPAYENRCIYDVVEQFALACPSVQFKLTIDGRTKCDFPKHRTLHERALAVLGRDLYAHLYPIQHTILDDVVVEGLYCSPDYSATKSGRMYTFVNRRIVRDKSINYAVVRAYQEFLHGNKPCIVLFLSLPADQIDVNVHPTKHEIRFTSPDSVFRAIYRALRSSLEQTPWIASSATDASSYLPPEELVRRAMGLPDAHRIEQNAKSQATPPPSHEEDAKRSAAAQQAARDLSLFNAPVPTTAPSSTVGELAQFHMPYQRQLPMPPTGTSQGATSCDQTSDAACPPPPSQPFAYFSNLYYIGQHDLTYLICSDGRDLIIIDQHAAHERINFERLKRVADALLPADAQLLMFPTLLNLDTRMALVFEEYRNFFEKLGFQFDEIGKNAYAIRAVPECLLNYDYEKLIQSALVDLCETGRANQFDDIRDDILATMACHQSIRAGEKLTPADAAELFRQMDATGFRSNCPHGRPVHFVLSHAELEKRFLRTGFPTHQ